MLRSLTAVVLLLIAVAGAAGAPASGAPVWASAGADGEPQVYLYFFWSEKCPHCQRARPFVEQLAAKTPWLQLESYELNRHPENVRRYVDMAAALGQEATSVPAFLFCGEMMVGYDDAAHVGAQLAGALESCRASLAAGGPARVAAAPAPATIALPWIGAVSLQGLSLPAMAVVLGGLDSFNPCAFFVLLFLLSLLVHARSRARMLAVGGIFVFFSGLVYFLFMAAWLNLFRIIGEIQAVTLAAGAVAVALGAVNIKDYFWFNRGPTLSIPDGAKPGLYRRARAIVDAERLPVMIAGAAVLAAVANSYELLCTAGFPMVFTRVLTLHELPQSSYYLYLALYNAVYVVPLMIIVAVFVVTLGSRKLSEREGRALKLLSGLMMLGLGALLVTAPQALNSPVVAAALLLAAVILTLAISRWSGARRA